MSRAGSERASAGQAIAARTPRDAGAPRFEKLGSPPNFDLVAADPDAPAEIESRAAPSTRLLRELRERDLAWARQVKAEQREREQAARQKLIRDATEQMRRNAEFAQETQRQVAQARAACMRMLRDRDRYLRWRPARTSRAPRRRVVRRVTASRDGPDRTDHDEKLTIHT